MTFLSLKPHYMLHIVAGYQLSPAVMSLWPLPACIQAVIILIIHSLILESSYVCPLHFSFNFVSFFYYQGQFMLPKYSGMCGLPLDFGWLIKDYVLREN